MGRVGTMSKLKRIAGLFAVGGTALLALFAWNGLEDSWRIPDHGTTLAEARKLTASELESGTVVSVMAWNLAKCFFHAGGTRFRTEDEVRRRLDRIAEVVREHDVDLLFLSEVVFEAGPCPVNQVTYLAEAIGFHAWCYGDNYSFGVPGYRIRSGNALLSRFPLKPVAVEPLPGGKPFWSPSNNRRLLWASAAMGGEELLCGSVRNDSFDLQVNALQVEAILASLGSRPALLAGDFNAEPGDRSMELLRSSGRFVGVFDGPATYPARLPKRRIDSVLLPRARARLLFHQVLDVDLSDHEPVHVIARFRAFPD